MRALLEVVRHGPAEEQTAADADGCADDDAGDGGEHGRGRARLSGSPGDRGHGEEDDRQDDAVVEPGLDHEQPPDPPRDPGVGQHRRAEPRVGRCECRGDEEGAHRGEVGQQQTGAEIAEADSEPESDDEHAGDDERIGADLPRAHVRRLGEEHERETDLRDETDGEDGIELGCGDDEGEGGPRDDEGDGRREVQPAQPARHHGEGQDEQGEGHGSRVHASSIP